MASAQTAKLEEENGGGKKLKRKAKSERIEQKAREEPGTKKLRNSFELPAGFTVIKRETPKKRKYQEYQSPDGRKYRSLKAIQRELAKGSEADSDHENNIEGIEYKLEPDVNIEEEEEEEELDV